MNKRAVQHELHPVQVLVVGYGNTLRGDDAVGVRVAHAVATWELPHVTTLELPQLTPEIAATLAGVDWVIFVDAGQGAPAADFRLSRIQPSQATDITGHSAEPDNLLSLTEALYQRCPQAWLLTIPYIDTSYGAPLSPTASLGMLAALRYLRDQLPKLGRLA